MMIIRCKILMKEPRTLIEKEYSKLFHIKSLKTKFQEIEEKIISEPETYPGFIMAITIEEMEVPMSMIGLDKDGKSIPPPLPELSGPREIKPGKYFGFLSNINFYKGTERID